MPEQRDRDFEECFDTYMDQEKLYRLEGRRGVEALCQVSAALGYKDPMYYGQLTAKATLGDFICFLEDNSGAVEAVMNWIKETGSSVPEWHELLDAATAEVQEPEELPEDDVSIEP
jgi:hypothetical protein